MDILHKAFLGFLCRLGQYVLAVFADIKAKKIKTVMHVGYHRLFL